MVSVVAQFSRKLVCEQKCTPEENYTQMNQPDQHHSPMAQGAGPYDRGVPVQHSASQLQQSCTVTLLKLYLDLMFRCG